MILIFEITVGIVLGFFIFNFILVRMNVANDPVHQIKKALKDIKEAQNLPPSFLKGMADYIQNSMGGFKTLQKLIISA